MAQENIRSRGVGYCLNPKCGDYAKLFFLLNHSTWFVCPDCRKVGKVENERGAFSGTQRLVRSVRVEYEFDGEQGVYRCLAMVTDESLPQDLGVYTLYSPLVRTEKRALKIAESVLANLQLRREMEEGGPLHMEVVLNFADTREDHARKCGNLLAELQSSYLATHLAQGA